MRLIESQLAEAAEAATGAAAVQLEAVARVIMDAFDSVSESSSDVAAASGKASPGARTLGERGGNGDAVAVPGSSGISKEGEPSCCELEKEVEQEAEEEVDEDAVGNETIHRLAPHYASEINSPLRHVR